MKKTTARTLKTHFNNGGAALCKRGAMSLWGGVKATVTTRKNDVTCKICLRVIEEDRARQRKPA